MDQELKQEFRNLNQKIDERFEKIDERLGSLENDVKSIKLTIENEIDPKIKIVAEGHLDLTRKMEEVLKHASQVEMLELHVKYIEMNMENDKLKTTNA